KSADGTIVSWNPAAQRMFGYTAAEVVGQSIDLLVSADPSDDVPRSGEPLKQLETIRVRRDGSSFPVSITFSPIWRTDGDGSQQMLGVSEVIRDISRRKQAEATVQREQRFAQSSIEAMPGVFYFFDDQGRFL